MCVCVLLTRDLTLRASLLPPLVFPLPRTHTHQVTNELAAHVHARGATIGVWTWSKLPFDNDNPVCWAAMEAAGVDFFTSNLPVGFCDYERERRVAAAVAAQTVGSPAK